MNVIAFDTETKGLDWFRPEHGAFLLSWADADGSYVCTIDDRPEVERFKDAIRKADVVVAHNLSFDVHQVRAALDFNLLSPAATKAELVDTAILARVVLPERAFGSGENNGYKLKNLAKTYLSADAKDAESAIDELAKSIKVKLKSTGGYYETWRAYPEEVEHYARLDAEYARDLYFALLPKLNEANRCCWELESKVALVLIAAEQRGIRVNPDIVEKLRTEYEPREETARHSVTEALGDFDLGSPAQLRDKLLEHGVPLTRKTPKGELATDKFALQEHADAFPVIDAVSRWREASKMLSTYIDPMSDRDTVHPSFWQMGAWTGRMSCSRPNMQNLPARAESADTKLREVFVPRKDHVFVVCDFDSIEIRLLAHYLNRPEYTQLIEDGLDPHAWMAAQINGGEPDDYAKGSPGEKKRSEAKNVLFAIIYGAGARRVADMLNIAYEDARQLVAKIKYVLPGYLALAGTRRPKGRVPRKIEAEGFVTTLYGRKQIVNPEKAYVGLNALIQGSAADIFKAALIAVWEGPCRLHAARPVLFVHDELVLECPRSAAPACLKDTITAMEGCYDLRPSLKVSGTIAVNNYAEGK